MNARLQVAGAAIVLVALLVAYRPVLTADFTYDGRLVAGENEAIRDPANARLIFSDAYYTAFGENTFRPLVTLTYILDAALWGMRAPGFGATNLLLHFAATLALMAVVRRRAGEAAALIAALIFAVHAGPSEAVYCVGHRETVLGGLFTFGAIALWDRGREREPGSPPSALAFLLAGAVYVVGLFAIESVILVPGYLLAEGVIRRDGTLRRDAKPLAVLFLAAAAFWSSRAAWFAGTRPPTPFYGGSRAAALAALPGFVGHYARILLWPASLRPDYAGVDVAIGSAAWIMGATVIALTVIAIVSKSVPTPVRTALAWMGISLVPVLHVAVPFWIPMAERYAYVAAGCMGFGLGAVLGPLALSPDRSRGRTALIAVALMIAALAVRTNARGRDWQNDAALWGAAARLQPESPAVWTNLAEARLRAHDIPGAEAAWREMLSRDPENDRALTSLATSLWRRGEKDAAYAMLRDAAAKGRAAIPATESLAMLLMRDARMDEAWRVIEDLDHTDAPLLVAARLRAQYHYAMGEWPTAVRAAEVCLSENGDEPVCRQIAGYLYMKAHQFDAAAKSLDICAWHATDEAMRAACVDGAKKARDRAAATPQTTGGP